MKWYRNGVHEEVVDKGPVTAAGEVPAPGTWGDPMGDPFGEGRAADIQARILKLLPKETYALAAVEKILSNPESIRGIASSPTMVEMIGKLTPEQRMSLTGFITKATSNPQLWENMGQLSQPAAPAPAGEPRQRGVDPGAPQEGNLKNMPSVTTPAPAIGNQPQQLSPYQQRLKGQQSI